MVLEIPLTPPPHAEHESETPYKGTPVWNVKATIVKYRVALGVVLLALIVVIVLAACGVFSSSSSSDSSVSTTTGNVTIYHAGSLVGLMDDKVAPAFTAATGIATSLVAKGSVKLANLIVNGSQADVFISADASVNSELLMGDANDNLISWYITFGETSVGLGYYPQSPYADVFTAVENGSLLWYEALLQNPDMKLGRTDPDADPKGYRTVMMFELAEEYYNTTGLISGILGNATNRDQIFSEENLETYLTSGDLDVGFFYAVEAGSLSGINFITLPEEINMGNPALNDEYATVSYTNSETGTVYNGSASIYTVTILNNATHMSEAEEFVAYLLSNDGQTILTEQGMESANLTAYGDTASIPSTIATYLS
ncbi:Molybdenum ABC transporter substrate-binding protein [Phytophthora palmivora]|uniref:Molybdenum ABC transporter substrate-binding protein n=1 Tax=Phytophthora palmivora TaxID=4796 RepID=A0A2P4XYP9_9STRA|nr:Molybdenum ABC transporter substrate-binding protein [Phytophthora palmivora]